MTYCQALELQTMACRGFLACNRLNWFKIGLPVPPLSEREQATLQEQAEWGAAATRVLWEEGIRFSFTRPLTEAEVVGAPRWNVARKPDLSPLVRP